jgi:hypothetical protein
MRGRDEAGPLPIVQYWHDASPPPYIEELIETFRVRNPDMPHMLFDRPSAEDLIAEHFSQREVAAFRSCGIPAMQADYFRYCAALAMGGLYCDADLRCDGGFGEIMPVAGRGWLVRHPHGAIVNGLFAFGSPGHALLELTVELVTKNVEAQRWPTVYLVTGPTLWTTIYWMHQAGSFDGFLQSAPNPMMERYGQACRDAIGDYERLRRAFEGVEIKLTTEAEPLARTVRTDLPYKETDLHWANVRDELYENRLRPLG